MKLLKNKRLLLIIVIILVLILIVAVNTNNSSNDAKNDIINKTNNKDAENVKFSCGVTADEWYKNIGIITYEQYQCLYESEEPFVLMLSTTESSYCTDFKSVIKDYAGENNLSVYVIEVNQLSNDEVDSLLSSLSYFSEHGWGFPVTLGIENKKVVSDIIGFTDDESELEKLFSPIINMQ